MTTLDVNLTLNGRPRTVEADGRLLLVELLRERLGCSSPRLGCLTGDCGACTVRVDGRVTKSCLVLAAAAEGCAVDTLEGLGEELEDLKAAFIARNGFQCGFCTTGMMLAAADLLARNPDPTEPEIRKAISGNLCRCTGYDSIVASVKEASRVGRER